ncbi:CLUMA_CG010791, isoform A [Clunio marinus]|uniref:CLUMA_CG010791, isoform A n=1 Tax=Clunio marinus TaxID=568069 RepID=A0A1J1IG29_9DIPT|nr:CLUMA_CG010791, isoform A [Clunio marinus]
MSTNGNLKYVEEQLLKYVPPKLVLSFENFNIPKSVFEVFGNKSFDNKQYNTTSDVNKKIEKGKLKGQLKVEDPTKNPKDERFRPRRIMRPWWIVNDCTHGCKFTIARLSHFRREHKIKALAAKKGVSVFKVAPSSIEKLITHKEIIDDLNEMEDRIEIAT